MIPERETHTLMLVALLLCPASSAHQDRSGRAPSLARSLPSPSLPSQIPRDHVALERAAHGSRATETPPPPSAPLSVHVSIPHSQPGGARGSLMRVSLGLASPFSSPRLYIFKKISSAIQVGAGIRVGPAGCCYCGSPG